MYSYSYQHTHSHSSSVFHTSWFHWLHLHSSSTIPLRYIFLASIRCHLHFVYKSLSLLTALTPQTPFTLTRFYTYILSQVWLYSTQLITEDWASSIFETLFWGTSETLLQVSRVLPAILQSAVEDRNTMTLSVTGNFQYPVGLGRWEGSKIWLRCLDDCYKSLRLNLSLCQYFYCFKSMS